jgi:exopolysaccharide biosynthesis predicted pyruvyltransferase EpsI
MFMLDLWTPSAEYAIFDDWEDWTRFYNYKQFLGAQKEFVVTDKYRKKFNILWGKPCIILSNERPDFKDWNWVKENSFICEINDKLF